MRRRIKTDKDYILILSKIYEVSFYIAQKFYNKANGIVEKAKGLLTIYKWQQEFALNS